MLGISIIHRFRLSLSLSPSTSMNQSSFVTRRGERSRSREINVDQFIFLDPSSPPPHPPLALSLWICSFLIERRSLLLPVLNVRE